ncbi:TPA: MptD family putative ECF transporter S component [Enterococcus faecalis]|uniref:MptD family putative ECF transporter S component n=1 Tax=Enterococcus TaxID=1350 RepID=UPI003CC6664C
MKTKDYIFIGLATVISLVIYFFSIMVSSIGGAFGHSISPGIFGLLSGIIFVYISYNYPRKGIFTIYTIVLLLFFTLMGGAYLPWFISSISMAILADIILYVFGYDRAIPQVVSWVLMQLGSAAGQWIPIWFFTDRFRQDWIDRGQSAATMDAMIHYAVGIWGIISVLVVVSLSMIGVLIGRKVLKKYKK